LSTEWMVGPEGGAAAGAHGSRQARGGAPAVFVLLFVRSAPGPCAILLLASPEPCRPAPDRGAADRRAGLFAGGAAVWGSFIGIAMRLPIGSSPFASRARPGRRGLGRRGRRCRQAAAAGRPRRPRTV